MGSRLSPPSVGVLMRWSFPLLGLVACSTGSPLPPAPRVVPPPIVSIAQPTPIAPPAPEPTPAATLAAYLQKLAPIDTPETLLVGIEIVPSAGYGPLYGEGAHAPPEDKLHTLVLHVHDGRVELVGELPFLAIPKENGFTYMGVASYERDDTEAEKKRQGAKFGADDDVGSNVYWYVASSLWRTSERAQVDAARTKARKSLEKQRKWGINFGEDINYVTREALCTTSYHAEWTGGALAFTANESQSLTGLSKKLAPALLKYTDDDGLLRFAKNIMREREPDIEDPDISLDEPYDMGWSTIDWRKDSRACLGRHDGKVMLTGVIRLPNNSARSSEWEAPVRDAPADLAANATPPFPLAEILAAFAVPKPSDALVSPRKTILVAQFQDGLVLYGARSATPLLTIPMPGRIVMAEWASGDLANTWAKVGDPPKVAASSCACGVGTICSESKCVKQ